VKLRAYIGLTLVCFMLGVGLVAQLRAQRAQYPLNDAPSVDQSAILGSLVVANAEMRNEVQKLQGEIQANETAPERSVLPQMNEDLRLMSIVNGRVEVVGPGVEVRVGAGVSAVDLQDLLNEVRNVGAEAIAINGHRVTVRTALGADSRGITLDGDVIESPFVFQALGDPTTMSTALNRRGGVLDLLRVGYPGLELTVKTLPRMVLPPVKQPKEFQLATPVQ